jgi:hypothetical protein
VRRRLDFERPVDPSLVDECLVVTNASTTAALADLYRQALEEALAGRPAAADR